MKDVKFRAWHKKRKKLYQVDALRWRMEGQTWKTDKELHDPKSSIIAGIKLISCYDGEAFETFFDDELILMQYIALKDKNQIVICESDIVKSLEFETLNEVVFAYGSFFFKWRNMAKEYQQVCHSFSNDESVVRGFEVIGNVWENPDLLK